MMKNCTKNLLCLLILSYSQEGNKNMKTNILIRICTKKKFVRKKANLFNLYASLNE